ncbi:MAG: Rpn family recombination-promoting nuclease/putative transposase [Peptococcaceae bacterium]|nr:Rpn family recombination-promoting nuclease/putative transposase [Peptococcaceae bacterium]
MAKETEPEKRKKGLSITNDLVFRKATTTPGESEEVLWGTIHDFFGIDAKDIVISNPYSFHSYFERDGEVRKIKETIKDISAAFDAGDFIVELQMQTRNIFATRSFFYTSDRFVKNFGAKKYKGLKRVLSLNIIGDRLIKSDEDAVHMFEFYDKKHDLVFPGLSTVSCFFEYTKTVSDDLEPWQRLFLGGEMKDSDPSWIKKIYGMLNEVNYTKEELEMIGETRYLNDIWEEIIEEEKQKALEEKQKASAAEKKALEAERQLAREREERLRLEEQIKELMKEAR